MQEISRYIATMQLETPKTPRDGGLSKAIVTACKWSATDIYHKYISVAQQSGQKISSINQPVKAG